MKSLVLAGVALVVLTGTSFAQPHAHLDTGHLDPRLRDRGVGVPVSLFGTYIQKGQFFIYPFFEYYYDTNAEYSPSELVPNGDPLDYEGKYTATEELLFLGYGVTDNLALEFEAAIIQTRLEKSPSDPTPDSQLPDVREEDGLGDVEGQIRYRFLRETESRPEFFTYFETVFPTADDFSLIGTSDYEFKLGVGFLRGWSFGTMTARISGAYVMDEDAFELGECSLEYLRRLSAQWRVYGGFEGTQDEVEFLTEAQWHFSRRAFVKLNTSFGVTSKATDWAPEVGLLITL